MSNLICEVCGAAGDNRCYTNCPGYKPLLKWKRPDRPAHQHTHCGRYWVERDPDGGHFNRWHAHRDDVDEQLTFDGFATREDAKWYCEKDADEEARVAAGTRPNYSVEESMAKAKSGPQRSFGEVLADVRDLQERFAHVRHFLSMAEHLFEEIEGDGENVKAVAKQVRKAFDAAREAIEERD